MRRNGKKSRILWLFLQIATVVLCSMFLTFIGSSVEDNHNTRPDGGGGGEIVGSVSALPEGSTVLGWRVSLLIGNDRTVKKTDGYSNYTMLGSRIYFASAPKATNSTTYIGSHDKAYYATKYINNYSANSYFTFHTIGSDYSVKRDIPTGEAWGRDEIKSLASNSAVYFRVNYMWYVADLSNNSVDIDKDLWLLEYEPITRLNGYNHINPSINYYFTPTEYVLSYRCFLNAKGDRSSQSHKNGFYNPFLTSSNPGLVGVFYAGIVAKPEDGSWLNLGSESVPAWQTERGDGGSYHSMFINGEDSLMRYAGAAYIFSQAFELPDYTASVSAGREAWECETIPVTTTINNSNQARGGEVLVTLTYNNGKGCSINGKKVNTLTKTVDLYNKTSLLLKWDVQVGVYDDRSGSDAGNRSFTVSIAPVESDQEIDPNNNTATTEKLTLKRDLSVSSVKINGQSSLVTVKENESVNVSFTVRNNNQYRDYNNVEIHLYLKRYGEDSYISLGSKTDITLKKNESKTGTATVNVGSVTKNENQLDTIVVTVNLSGPRYGAKYWHEANLDNNRNKHGTNASSDIYEEGNILVMRIISLEVQIIRLPEGITYSDNAASVQGGGKTATDGMMTCVIKNGGNFNLYTTSSLSTTNILDLTAQKNGSGSLGTIGSIPVPAKGTNLGWFKFSVPTTPGTIRFNASLKWTYYIPEYYKDEKGELHVRYSKQYRTYSATPTTEKITERKVSATPDTGLVKNMKYGIGNEELVSSKANTYASAKDYTTKKPKIAQWSLWTQSGGSFTRHRYALAADVTASLVPMETAKANNGATILSGSGFSINFSYSIRTESDRGDAVTAYDYTRMQNAIARFPEFGYKITPGSCRTLFFKNNKISDNSMMLAINSAADDLVKSADSGSHVGQRVHFTPLNMPDGAYLVGIYGYDLWTPAGMIYVNATPSLTISGSIYNDSYIS